MPTPNPRQREMPLDAARLRDAQKIVRPYQAELAQCHQKFALLRGLQSSSQETDVKSRAAESAAKVSELRSRLQADVMRAGATAAQHSVVRDMDRAMVQLTIEFEGLAQLR